ncbi:MAG: carbohydrate ABC transporter permease, partial [Psychromonas sp.]
MANHQSSNKSLSKRLMLSLNQLRRSPLMLLVHLSVLLLVILWTLPTAGLLISSFRDKDQLAVSGWWTALSSSEQNIIARTVAPDQQTLLDGQYVLTGEINDFNKEDSILRFGWQSREPEAYQVGSIAEMGDGGTLRVESDGKYTMTSLTPFSGSRGKRIFYTALASPKFSLG